VLGELLGGSSAVLDGEVVALDPANGRPSFGRLQERMSLRRSAQVRAAMAEVPVVLMLFDVLELHDRDTMPLPYTERRGLLEGLGLEGGAVHVPPAWIGDPEAAVAWTREHGLEGVVLKRLAGRYRAGVRSSDWLKLKFRPAVDVVVGGWLEDETGEPRSLLVGVPSGEGGGLLEYRGAVGSGLGPGERLALAPQLARLAADTCPFAGGPAVLEPRMRRAHWLRPELRGEVEYADITALGRLRQPVWRGVRSG
jgi:bifunctional non-homologous end joining protein LigD